MFISRKEYERLEEENSELRKLKESLEETLEKGQGLYTSVCRVFQTTLRDVSFSEESHNFGERLKGLNNSELMFEARSISHSLAVTSRSLSGMIQDFKVSPMSDINHRLIFYMTDAMHNMPLYMTMLDSDSSFRSSLIFELRVAYGVLHAFIAVEGYLYEVSPYYRGIVDSVRSTLKELEGNK